MSSNNYIYELITKATKQNKGKPSEEICKEIKVICKSSQANVTAVYKQLHKQLQANHSEIRLGSLFIIDMLFEKSKSFRDFLISDLHDFLQFTLEVGDVKDKIILPPPKDAAKRLKENTVNILIKWQKKFGTEYKKLSLAHNYLTFSNQIDFRNNARTMAEKRKHEVEEKRKKNLKQKRLNDIETEINSNLNDMRCCMIELQNCFDLLVPNINHDILSQEETDLFNQKPWNESNFTITKIQIEEDENNEHIIVTMNDRMKLVETFLIKIQRWLKLMTKYADDERIKRLINMKNFFLKAKKQREQINIKYIDQTDDEDFEVVSDVTDPSNGMIVSNDHYQTLKLDSKLSKIQNSLGSLYGHNKFMSNSDNTSKNIDDNSVCSISNNFDGDREKIKWKCRKPLKNGILCPRMDRFKCPFHGRIIARDDNGIAKNPHEENDEPNRKPIVDDDEFLRDIEVAIDIKLKKNPMKKKKLNEQLTKVNNDKVRQRLKKKIFKK